MSLIDIIAQVQAGKVAAAMGTWPECAGKPYRPGSGTEGMAFDEVWCDRCTRDAQWRKDESAPGCQILSDTFLLDVTDTDYPKEWVYDRNGVPCCTAFTTDPNQPVRCDKTIDMFDR